MDKTSSLANIKVIESRQLDFHPTKNLTEMDMQHLHGGLCNYMKFSIQGWCTCDKNCFLRTGKPKPANNASIDDVIQDYPEDGVDFPVSTDLQFELENNN